MMDLPELIVLDVGHGNCAVLRDREAVTVIDCPPPATTLVETLEVLDINIIDQILISHADIDHAGGLPSADSAGPPGLGAALRPQVGQAPAPHPLSNAAGVGRP